MCDMTYEHIATSLRTCLTNLATALLLFGGQNALAASHGGNSVNLENPATVSLMPGWTREDGLYVAALRFDLAPGWKTYWREPGSNGIAPTFNWTGSENLAQVGILWPTPKVYQAYGTRTIGYKDQLILPIVLRPDNPSKPISVQLQMDFGVCEDVCVAARSSVSGMLDLDQVENRSSISNALAQRPTSGQNAGLISAVCKLDTNGQDFILRAELRFGSAPLPVDAVVIESGNELMWISETDHSNTGNNLNVEADLQYYGEGAMAFDRSRIRFTILGPGRGIDVTGCVGPS